MKKIIALLAAAIMLLCTACTSSGPDSVEQDPETLLQMDVISSFGITQKQNRIIAYKGENYYLEYFVAMYDGDTKTSEKTYYFYNDTRTYNEFKEKNSDNPTMTFFDDARYVIQDTGIANSGTYDGDYMIAGKKYEFR